MLEVLPLGSGSRGNATLIRSSGTAILIDAGLTRRQMLDRLGKAAQDPAQLAGILLTHRHRDHCRSAATLCRRFHLPLYATPMTSLHQQPRTLPEIRDIQPGQTFTIGELRIQPLTLSHDAPETQAFVVEQVEEGHRIGIATDLGYASDEVSGFLEDLDVLCLEFNHDRERLLQGPYPAALKERVSSPLGHLSNAQAAELLAQVASPRLQALYLCHLSQQNNEPSLAREAASAALQSPGMPSPTVQIAYQDSISEGFCLKARASRG